VASRLSNLAGLQLRGRHRCRLCVSETSLSVPPIELQLRSVNRVCHPVAAPYPHCGAESGVNMNMKDQLPGGLSDSHADIRPGHRHIDVRPNCCNTKSAPRPPPHLRNRHAVRNGHLERRFGGGSIREKMRVREEPDRAGEFVRRERPFADKTKEMNAGVAVPGGRNL
jgi:hypothetical protein